MGYISVSNGKIWNWRLLGMNHDFIDDLLDALNRVMTPDVPVLKEILIVCGMPEKTASLRYLSLNRQGWNKENRSFEFSAVAVINNRRATRWRLEGYHKKLSQIVFNNRWTRNSLDLFTNNLRCNPEMVDILSAANGNYTLLGILKMKETRETRFFKIQSWRIWSPPNCKENTLSRINLGLTIHLKSRRKTGSIVLEISE